MAAVGRVEEIDRRIRSARVHGWLVGGAAVVLSLLYRAAVDTVSDGDVRDLLVALGAVLLLSSAVVGYRAYGRALPSAGVILWLRRFEVQRASSFGALLEQASRGIGYPVAVQDSRYSASYPSAMLRAPTLVPVLGLLWAFGAVMLAAVVGTRSPPLLAAVLTAFSFLLWRAATSWLRHLGYRTVGAAVAHRELERVAHTRGKGRRRPALGIEVLKVPDGDWHALVRQGLGDAVLAVVDVTVISATVGWELATASERLGSRRIILAAEQESADPHRIARELAEVARHPVDPGWVTSALFAYSGSRQPSTVDPAHREEIRTLHRMLAERVTDPAAGG